MANKEKLFTEFTAPTTQEWLDKIEVDLKGADFQKRLVSGGICLSRKRMRCSKKSMR